MTANFYLHRGRLSWSVLCWQTSAETNNEALHVRKDNNRQWENVPLQQLQHVIHYDATKAIAWTCVLQYGEHAYGQMDC